MASSKDIYEAKVFAANIYAAGVFRGAAAAAVVPADEYWGLRGVENVNVELRSAENVNVELRGDL